MEEAGAARLCVGEAQEDEAGEAHGGADGEVEVGAVGCYMNIGGAAVDRVGWVVLVRGLS